MSRRGTTALRRAVALASVSTLTTAGLLGGASLPATAAEEPEQIVNGSFDDGLTGWNNYPGASVVDGRGCIDVPAGSGPYSAAITQEVPLLAGETYALSFSALTTPAAAANVRVVVQGGPDVNYFQFLTAQRPALTAEPQELRYTFTPDRDYAAAELAFQQDITNTAAYRLCVDDVSLTGGAEPEQYVPDTGPRVRVNQYGYLPRGPKGATLVTDSTRRLVWQVRTVDGIPVARGLTQPRGVDPSAGLNVHSIDFSHLRRSGQDYTLVVDGETSHPFEILRDLYEPLRDDSKTVYYTNRSGIEIDEQLAPGYGRPAGHVGVAPNSGDLAVPCQDLDDDSQALYDQPWTCEGTRDVSGGWYDAGDHGKYAVNTGISAAMLLMEYERSLWAPTADDGAYADGTLAIPEAGNQVPDLLDEARWGIEWMLKMQVPAGQQYAGMVNHKVADVDWTGLPLLPSDDPQRRVLYRPSTAATLHLAAVGAQAARLFEPYDREFAARALEASLTAYEAAQAEPDLYAPAPDPEVDPNPGSGPYNDDDATDEFYWAAAELFLTTGEREFRQDIVGNPHHTGDVFTARGFDWAEVAALGRLDLATVPSRIPGRSRIVRSVVEGADSYLEQQARQPFGQPYEPEGGNYIWGSNSQILNNMVVLGTAYDLTGRAKYSHGVLRGMDYILGRNALNISYVTGYGDVYAENMHSRWYANQVDPSSPNPPQGTLAGGPNSTATSTGDPVAVAKLQGCVAQFCYLDDIGSWSTNELTINWNASLSWVSSFVADQELGGRLIGNL